MTTLAKPKKIVPAAQPADVRPLSMNVLEVLPDQYQTRDNTDPAWVLQYHRDMTETYGCWGQFPPALAYELPDGRFVLVGGFTRLAAYEKTVTNWNRTAKREGKPLLERVVPCRVVKGTESEALLASIADNRAKFHRGRKFTMEDAARSVEMLVRNEVTRDYSDAEIGRRCGLAGNTAARIRVELLQREGIGLPNKVLMFRKDGRPTGRMHPYKANPKGVPTIREVRDNRRRKTQYYSTVEGKTVYLGTDSIAAEQKLADMVGTMEVKSPEITGQNQFTQWLKTRGISLKSDGHGDKFGYHFGGTPVIATPADTDSLLAAIGRAAIARKARDSQVAIVVCGKTGANQGCLAYRSLAAKHLPPEILIMAPDEFVAYADGPED